MITSTYNYISKLIYINTNSGRIFVDLYQIRIAYVAVNNIVHSLNNHNFKVFDSKLEMWFT